MKKIAHTSDIMEYTYEKTLNKGNGMCCAHDDVIFGLRVHGELFFLWDQILAKGNLKQCGERNPGGAVKAANSMQLPYKLRGAVQS